MEISWELVAIVFVINTLLCLSQLAAQQWELKRGKIAKRGTLIPGTEQKFLHWQEFSTQTWGDLVGLFLVQVSFAHLCTNGKITQIQWAIGIAIGISAASAFTAACLRPSHKPDWGFPKAGKASWGGISHLPYFGANSGVAALCLYHLYNGSIHGLVMWIGLVGGAAYVCAFVTGIVSGNFEPLKPSEK